MLSQIVINLAFEYLRKNDLFSKNIFGPLIRVPGGLDSGEKNGKIPRDTDTLSPFENTKFTYYVWYTHCFFGECTVKPLSVGNRCPTFTSLTWQFIIVHSNLWDISDPQSMALQFTNIMYTVYCLSILNSTRFLRYLDLTDMHGIHNNYKKNMCLLHATVL